MSRKVRLLVCTFTTSALLLASTFLLAHEPGSRPNGAENSRHGAASKTAFSCRHLRVVLYPYVPDYQGFARQIAKNFKASAEGKDIALEPVDLTDGYYDSKSDEYIGRTTADIYEIDSVLLTDMATAHQIRPLPDAIKPAKDEFIDTAQRRTLIGGTAYGYPQWVCANFLFYRSDDSAIAGAKTLADLEHAMATPGTGSQWLLADLKGSSTLGEFYLMALFDQYKDWSTVAAHLSGLENEEVSDVLRLAALCDHGRCHSATRHAVVGAYGREFAHGRGRILVGYSETLYYVGAENALCSKADNCLSTDALAVKLVPLDDQGVTPMIWVDNFALSPGDVLRVVDF